MVKTKALEIDGIFASELRDQQGELLSLEGADISDLQSGMGVFNDNHSAGLYNVLGKITFAKKIFKKEDCTNDRERYFWEKVKAPILYGKGVLFNDEDHPNAKAAAAILRSIHKSDCPLKLKASVEGGVISKGILDPTLLKQTKIKRIALTFVPANNATLIEPVSLDKSNSSVEEDALLIKSVMHLAQEFVPSFREIEKAAKGALVASNIKRLTLGIRELKEIQKEKQIENKIKQIQSTITLLTSPIENIPDQNLNKGIKDSLKAAALGTVLATAPIAVDKVAEAGIKHLKQATKQTPSHADYLKGVAKQYPFLGAIAQVESSGGQNLNHKQVTAGLNSGHTAGGMYGMMPKTAAFILSKNPDLALKYPDIADAAKNIKDNHAKITDRFNSDPVASSDFAIALYNRSKHKTRNDEMLAYSWLNGLKGAWDKYKEEGNEGIAAHPYVKKVMQALPKEEVALNKALSAGYGGASSPMMLSGGGVLQGTGIKYITCPACQKEQVSFKDQLRCRKCNKAFNMSTLSKLFVK